MIREASLLFIASWLAVAGARGENVAGVKDVRKLNSAGVPVETIVAFIQSKNINYDLSADNVLKLRNEGIPTAIINALLTSGAGNTGPVATQPTPSPQPAPVPAATTEPPPQPVVATVATVATASPDVAYFYQELSPYGRWILAEDGQWCWQPREVSATREWRPYWDKGHWVWTDHGWYWSSEYPWGWAAFHYGRWHLHPHHGWVWFPDRVWGPSWVVWRHGGQYSGWAPLPPGAVYDTAGARFVYRGKVVDAGFDFGLGFTHFSFCYTRELGEPMSRHFRGGPEFRTAFDHTTIVNHYTVNRVVVGGETHVQVFNHGVDHDRIVHARGRPLEEVKVQELSSPAPGRAHEHLDPHARTIDIYRPHFNSH